MFPNFGGLLFVIFQRSSVPDKCFLRRHMFIRRLFILCSSWKMQEFLASKQREKSKRITRTFRQVPNILYLFDLDLIHFNSLHCSHVNRLTCLQCFLQGDIGLTGPPGIPGPPVSTIYSTVPFIYTESYASAAGKRSMAFHSTHRVAAIKTSTP